MKTLIKAIFGFFILSFCSIQILSAQCSSVVIKGYVEDENNHPINNVAVLNSTNGMGVNVGSDGYFILNSALPAKIKITSLGYQTQQKEITSSPNCDTVKLTFVLVAEISQIAVVNIVSDNKPHCIASADNLLDFEIKNRELCTLSTVSGGRRFCVFDSTSKLVVRKDVKYKMDKLYRTQNNLVCMHDDDSVHFFGWDKDNGLAAVYTMPTPVYKHQIELVVAMDTPNYYYCRNERLMGGASLWVYNKHNGGFKMLYSYYNNAVAQRNRENVGLSRDQPQMKRDDGTDIVMSSATVKELEDARGEEAAMSAAWLFNYDALILLRHVRDSIYIFNFENDSMYVLDHNDKRIRSLPIGFEHRGFKYDKRDIAVNENGNECCFTYCIHDVYYVDRIDLNNGKKISTNKLQFISVKKIRVQDNYTIYSYTDGVGKTYIYKQGLY